MLQLIVNYSEICYASSQIFRQANSLCAFILWVQMVGFQTNYMWYTRAQTNIWEYSNAIFDVQYLLQANYIAKTFWSHLTGLNSMSCS